MNTLDSVELVLGFMWLSAGEAWAQLRASHPELLADRTTCEIDGESTILGDVDEIIKAGDRHHFGVKVGPTLTISYAHVRNFEHSVLQVDRAVHNFDDAWRWVERFARSGALLQARLFDPDYEYWQNAVDPLQYAAAGRPWEHLPRRPNLLPPPLQGEEIDISGNPGRRVLRRGYVEAVGALMWLAEDFWSRTGASRAVVEAQSWLHCQSLGDDVMRLEAAKTAFRSSHDVEGRTQNALRRLLYAPRDSLDR